MIKRIYALMLVSLFVASCNRSTLDEPTVQSSSSSNQITFGLGADWTRGVNIEDTDDIPSLSVYSYYVNYSTTTEATEWGDITSAEDLLPLFTSPINTSFILTNEGYGDSESTEWSYTGGTRYWPTTDDEKLSFIAIYPDDEITLTPNETSGKPEFSYSMSEFAIDNNDFVMDARYDLTAESTTNGEVTLALQHPLTKITLKAAISGEVPSTEKLGYYDETTKTYADEYFVVNGISFSGLYKDATLDIDINSDGSRSLNWTHDKTSTIEVTAAQDNAILPIYIDGDEDTALFDSLVNPNAKLTTTLQSVMEEGEAIFVLPQDLGTTLRTTAPTTQVRIRRLYYTKDDLEKDDNGDVKIYYKYENTSGTTVTGEGVLTATPSDITGEVTYYFNPTSAPNGELIYSTLAIEIPSASSSGGWAQGEHNVLEFTFYLDKLTSYYVPMTVYSQIYDWTYIDVETTVQANTYIYADDSYIQVDNSAEYADFCIYTNYDYDLRRHRRKYELDGTPTEAAGFTYYSLEDESYTLDPDDGKAEPDSWDDTGSLEPVLLWSGSSSFSSGKDYEYDNLIPYTYVYNTDDELCITADGTTLIKLDLDSDGHFDPTDYQDSEGWMYFAIQPTGSSSTADFYYKVKKESRAEAGLYVNTSIEDSSYGVNKSDDDAVYTLRLSINDGHLKSGSGYGYFFGKIGAELLSNGGGMFTTKFKVILEKAQ